MKDRNHIIILSIGICICVISSLSLFKQSIRLDESQQIWISTKSVSMIMSFIAQDVHVPLYSILLHFWMQLFGSSIFVARIPSLVFFLGTLPVLYAMYNEAGNKKIATMATIAFACSPFLLWYSSEARMYTLFTFATAWNMLFFFRFVKSYGRLGKVGYFISEIFGLYSHYFFVFVLITQAVFLIGKFILSLQEHRTHPTLPFSKEWSKTQQSVILLLSLMILGFCFLIPWLVYVASLGSASNTQPLIPQPTSFNIFQTFVSFFFGFQSGDIQATLISFWPVIVVGLFFIFTQKKIIRTQTTTYFFLSAFLPIILVFILSYFRPIYLSRYLIFTLPSLFFLLAWMIDTYLYKVENIVMGCLVFLFISAGIYQNYSPTTTVKEDYADVSFYLENHAKSDDIIIVTPPFTLYPIEYSYNGVASITTIPQWSTQSVGPIPPFSQDALITQVNALRKQYTRMFIIFSYDQGYQQEVMKYFDTHFHRISLKDFSPGLEIREYQLRYDI